LLLAALVLLPGCGGGGGGGGGDGAGPAIAAPADRLSVFHVGRPGGAESFAQTSATLSEKPIRRAAYPGPGELRLRALVEFTLTKDSITFLGNEEGVYEPPIVFPRRARSGRVIEATDYTFRFHGSGVTEPRSTPPMVAARGTVRVLGADHAAQLLYVLDPTRPAQTLHLEESSFGLDDEYPDYDGEMPGGSPRAVIGIQIYTAAHGLVGLVAVDPVTGEVTGETALKADLPRPGLSGGAHGGRVTVWTIDARSGVPFAGTAVVVAQGALTVRTRTDAEGKAVVSGLAPGAYSVSAGGRALKARSFAGATAACAVLPLPAEEPGADELLFGAVEAGEGETVSVPLYVSCAEDTVACSLALKFDPRALQIVGQDLVGFADTCALKLNPALVSNPLYWVNGRLDNDEGWIVVGMVFDGLGGADPPTVIPAGTSRARLLDLNVRVGSGAERWIMFANAHPALVPTSYNVLSTVEGVSMRPCGKPALITPPGACQAVKKLAEDGGTLFAPVEFHLAPSNPGSVVRVTGSKERAGGGRIETSRSNLYSDAFAGVAGAGGALDAAGALFLLEPGAHDLEVAPLGAGEKVAVEARGAAPPSFGAAPAARQRALLFGPAGAAGALATELGAAELGFDAAEGAVAAEAEFPRLWDLPAMLVVELEAPIGESAYRCKVDARAAAPAPERFDFLDVPALIAPASSASMLDLTERGEALRWRRVREASFYIVSFSDSSGAVLWEIFVPAGRAAAQTVVVPPLPESCELAPRVAYRWKVTAVAAAGTKTAVSGAVFDLLALGLAEERRATCAPRIVRWE